MNCACNDFRIEVTQEPQVDMMPESSRSLPPAQIAVSSPCLNNKKPDDNDGDEALSMAVNAMDRTTETGRSVMVEPSMESTPGLAEVRIENLDQVCNQVQARVADPLFGQLFKITVLFSTTVTSTSTVVSTATSFSTTNTFVISSCTPSPFPYTTCTTAG